MNLTITGLTLEQLEAVVKTLKKVNYVPSQPVQSLDGEPEPPKPKE
jgi:hypothetical protein